MFVTIKSWISLKLGYVRSKSRSLGQIFEKPFLHSKGLIVLLQSLWNVFKMFIFMESRGSLRLGQIGLISRSLGQILEKSYINSRGPQF